MVGIDIADTIVVRRSVDKGTRMVQDRIKKLNFAGEEFKKYQKENQKITGNIGLASSKGTGIVHLSYTIQTKF